MDMDSSKVTVRMTKRFGRGVFATQRIRKGEIVSVFNGAVYDGDFDGWNDDLYNHTIQFGKELWRDSKGVARLINHSCEPNCGIKDFFKVVAMRTIEAGEQITWDYEMTEKNPTWRMRCKCGSDDCRGIIGNYSNMPQRFRKKYGQYISGWLRGESWKLQR